jgi:hypothetical protein
MIYSCDCIFLLTLVFNCIMRVSKISFEACSKINFEAYPFKQSYPAQADCGHLLARKNTSASGCFV